jgi:hypothetical protein
MLLSENTAILQMKIPSNKAALPHVSPAWGNLNIGCQNTWRSQRAVCFQLLPAIPAQLFLQPPTRHHQLRAAGPSTSTVMNQTEAQHPPHMDGTWQPSTLAIIIPLLVVLIANGTLGLWLVGCKKPRRARDDFDQHFGPSQGYGRGRQRRDSARAKRTETQFFSGRDISGLQSPVGLQFPQGQPYDDGFEMVELQAGRRMC